MRRFHIKFKPAVVLLPTLIAFTFPLLFLLRAHREHKTPYPPKPRLAQDDSSSIPVYQGNLANLPIPCVILPSFDGLGYIGHGTGDQMFIYAFAYATARNINAPLFLGITKNDTKNELKYGPTDRKFALRHFKLKSTAATIVQYLPHNIINLIGKENISYFDLNELGPWKRDELPKDKIIVVRITSYWQSDIYFGDYQSELASQLLVRNVSKTIFESGLITEIESTDSVAVHIRKGDFDDKVSWNGSFNRWIPITYQLRAMDLMQHLLKHHHGIGLTKFFLFTDDREYVMSAFNNITQTHNFTVVSNPANLSSFDEFHLMSKCKHNIIATSGFSWWAAFVNINADKLVIAPFPKFRNKYFEPQTSELNKHKAWMYWNHAYPKTWITINPYTNFKDSS